MTGLRLTLIAACVLLAARLAYAADVPNAWKAAWPDTDFSTALVDLGDVQSGGPPKDGIPSIDNPSFHAVPEENDLLPNEAVVAFETGGGARAYPIRYLMWHEIVNDEIAGQPIAVTYCPLCNSAIVFDRRLDGRTLSFGVSGMLRHSDMIMYDRETESWWQQFTGESFVGELVGKSLKSMPARLESWARFKQRHPQGQVMSQPQGYLRMYGRNPYVGYDTLTRPWLYDGEPPASGLPMMARVVRVEDRAWPLQRIVDAGTVTEDGITLRWEKGQASSLDTDSVAGGRDVGNVEVADAQGRALPHEVTFAFVFQAFHPDGRWMMGR